MIRARRAEFCLKFVPTIRLIMELYGSGHEILFLRREFKFRLACGVRGQYIFRTLNIFEVSKLVTREFGQVLPAIFNTRRQNKVTTPKYVFVDRKVTL